MTAAEKATAKIAALTADQLFSCWEMTEHLSISEEAAITRGWLMHEVAKRYPEGFDAWLDQSVPEDSDLRRFCLANSMCLTCVKFVKDCSGTTSQVWTGCTYKEVK